MKYKMDCDIMSTNLTNMLFMILMISLELSHSVSLTNVTVKINKCCARNQELYLDGFENFKCINFTRNRTVDQKTNGRASEVFKEENIGDLPHEMDESRDDVWWIPDYMNFIETLNNSELKVIESVQLTRRNFIFNKPIACFEQEPEFLLVQSNVFIDINSGELVLSELEKGPEHIIEEAFKENRDVEAESRKKRDVRQRAEDDNFKMAHADSTLVQKRELLEEIEIVRNVKEVARMDRKIKSKFPNEIYCIDRIAFKAEEDQDFDGRDNTSAAENGNKESDASNWSHDYVTLLCPCQARTNSNTVCVRKCCMERHLLLVSDAEDRNARCVPHEAARSSDFDVTIVNTEHGPPQSLLTIPHYIVHGTPRCRHGSYLLRNNANATSASSHFQILRNSSLFLTGSRHLVDASQYCIDSIYYASSQRRIDGNILLCLLDETRDHYTRRIMYSICFIVGTGFLVLTLGVYAVLSELRKSVHSWNIMAHIACSIVAYTAIVVANLYSITYPTLCVLVAYVLQISFLSSQLWLNAMCVDIAFTFSGLRAPGGRHFSDVDRRKFIYYSVYTWGTTALISALTYLADNMGVLANDNPLKPNFGVKACWFKESASIAAFFYGPISLLLVANLVLFHYTCWKIRAAQKDTDITSAHRHVGGRTDEQTRLTTFIKLFLLMGVTWTFEIVSWVLGGPYYLWYLTDLLNVLRGVFIFLILCCKRNVLAMLHRRIKQGRRRRRGNAGPRPRAESINSRRHSKSSITTEHMALSRLNLSSNNQGKIPEEEEGGVSPGAGGGEGQAQPPSLSVVEEEEREGKC